MPRPARWASPSRLQPRCHGRHLAVHLDGATACLRASRWPPTAPSPARRPPPATTTRSCRPRTPPPRRRPTTRPSRSTSHPSLPSRPSPTSRAPGRPRRSRPDRQHPGRRHRGVPDRRAQRLLHPDARRRHRRTPPTRSSSTAAQRLRHLPGGRRLRRGDRQAAEFSGATQIVANDAGVIPIAALGDGDPQDPGPRHRLCAARHRVPRPARLSTRPARSPRARRSSRPLRGPRPTSTTAAPYYSDGTNRALLRRDRRRGQQRASRWWPRPRSSTRRRLPRSNERKAYNDAHRIILDDASSLELLHDPEHRLAVPVVHRRAHRARSARRSPSPSRSCSPSASTPGGSCRSPRSSAHPPASSRSSRRPGPRGARERRRRRQARDVQRAELLPDHRRGVRRLAGSAPAPTSTTAPATRSPTTPATPTVRAVPPTTPTWSASATRSSRPSTRSTPTSSPWRSSRTPSSSARTATSRSTSW